MEEKKEKDSSEWGVELKEARLRAGLSQREMVAITGIPRRTIQSWELGERQCRPWQKQAILNMLAEIEKKKNKIP